LYLGPGRAAGRGGSS